MPDTGYSTNAPETVKLGGGEGPLVGAGGLGAMPDGSVALSWTGSAGSETDLTEYTFTDVPAGVAHADRRLIVAVVSRDTVEFTLDTVTIGGFSATQLASHIVFTDGTANHSLVEFWGAAVPTGTTATVVTTFSGAVLRTMVSLYRALNLNSLTPTDSQASGIQVGSVLTAVLDAQTGGAVLAAAYTNTGTTTWAAPLTEDVTVQALTSGSGSFSSAQTVTAQVTVDTSAANRLLAVALR